MCTLGAGKRNRNTEEIASELLTNGEQSYEKDKKEKWAKLKSWNHCQLFSVFQFFLNIIF
jgi:hypothetical protein